MKTKENKMKPNRRKFLTPKGRVIETNFDVYWYTIDDDGSCYLYNKRPNRFVGNIGIWISGFGNKAYYCENQTGNFDYKTCRWYLNDNGEWTKE
jgi:hypothetical protein